MSWAIWITGRPGSGKSTIARRVAAALEARGVTLSVLEASAFCAALIPGRVPTAHELDIVHRALTYTACLLTQAGIPVIIDATAHRREWRDHARSAIGHFAEVQLVCPPEICDARERAVRWTPGPPAASPSPAVTAPELVLDYEQSFTAELTVDTEAQHVWTAVEHVIHLAEVLHRHARRQRPAS